MWFTPIKTTKQMIQETGQADFVFEISCDQMCGKGHTGMRGEIIVETQEEYDLWMAKQKPQYLALFPDKDPSSKPKTDTAGVVKQVAVVSVKGTK
jgi:cytochrome c oxidase subunit 2